MTSIREVAKLAGVSPSTVSRVMNQTANVDDEKKMRVLAAIEETGFKPNELARALFKKSSKIIGVIVPTIENPFFNEMAKAIEEEAYKNGYRILLCNSNADAEKERINMQMLSQMKADGLILMTNNDKNGEVIADYDLPVVVVDRMIKGDAEIADIESDHYNGGRIAAEHLIDCGCKNIVCIRGPQELSSGKRRYQGYQDVCRQYGIKEQYVEGDYSYETGLRVAEELLREYPEVDGIIASNDMVAISIYKVLKKKGYRVPEDVQLIGFDNISLGKLFTPELTTIRQPIMEMGTLAVELIVNHINGIAIQRHHVLGVNLIKRESTRKKIISCENAQKK